MKDLFLDNQIWIALILGGVCVLIIFLIVGERGMHALVTASCSLVLIGIGGKLFETDTSENWVKISYGVLVKHAIGGGLMLIGWGLMLRGVVAPVIASLLLRWS